MIFKKIIVIYFLIDQLKNSDLQKKKKIIF